MPYTPSIYQPYGQMYGNYSQAMPQQPQQNQQQPNGLIWVDGEVGAKAYQLPAGFPANTPIALWDTNDTYIYLRSMNQTGMPNPIQKIRYQIEGQSVPSQRSGANLMSGATETEPVEPAPRGMEAFATKNDLEKMRVEITQAIADINAPATTATTKKGKANEPSV